MSEIPTPPPAPTPAPEAAPPAGAVPQPGAAAAAAAPANVANVIDIQQFGAVELKVGQVLLCEAVPKSEKLLRMMVDVGEGAPRQLVAGIAKAYRPEQLTGTQVVIVANLKAAKLMGLESNGMVLAATQADGQPVLLRPETAVAPGTRVK